MLVVPGLMPSDSGLAARVLDRLNKVAATKDDSWKLLVLAALEGDEPLADAIEAGATAGTRGGKSAGSGSRSPSSSPRARA
jgi:hypothetical protein